MPQGLLDGNHRDLLNYSLSEWQQAKRQGEDSKALQKMFQNCWAVSDNRPSFEQALQRYGLYLAKRSGNRTGVVRSQPLSAARHGAAISARRVALTDGSKGKDKDTYEPHAAHSRHAPGSLLAGQDPIKGLAERSGVEPGAAKSRGR